jgi:hypothetical protein
MWLYDLLPKDLPNARIMTYGYNSNLAEDATTGRIRDFAKGLLNDLDNYRTKEVCANAVTLSFFFFSRPAKHIIQERERPIIYICHSLGGLVVKQVSERCLSSRFLYLAGPPVNQLFQRPSSLQIWNRYSITSKLQLMASSFWGLLTAALKKPILQSKSQLWPR